MSSYFLACIQGITEFLPVSSSAHLLMFSKWFDLGEATLNSMISLHIGTLLAVLVFYGKDVLAMAFSFVRGALCPNKRDNPHFQMAICVLIASIPAVIFGFFVKPYMQCIQDSLVFLAVCSLVFGALLAFVDSYMPQDQDEITKKRAFLIGLGQAVSIIPGSSRLGMTVTMARILGRSRSAAFRFSMFLSIPAVAGATSLMLLEQKKCDLDSMLSSMFNDILATFIVGFITLFLVQRYIDHMGFVVFGLYRILFGLAIFWWAFMEGHKIWF